MLLLCYYYVIIMCYDTTMFVGRSHRDIAVLTCTLLHETLDTVEVVEVSQESFAIKMHFPKSQKCKRLLFRHLQFSFSQV